MKSKVDHDPTFGISDADKSFVGFHSPDKDNYIFTMFHIEGDKGIKILKNVTEGSGPLVASRRYSSEIKFQFRPTKRWGSCHTEHDEGYTNIANYQHTLDLTKGLYFEFYSVEAHKKYHIRYALIEVDME